MAIRLKKKVDLDFFPAAHLECVVDRCHAENALAVGQLEVNALDHNGHGVPDIHNAKEEHQLRPPMIKARAVTIPPRNMLPVSPMNTLAG